MSERGEGEARIVGGAYLQFVARASRTAIPSHDWAFPLATIKVIGAYTRARGLSMERFYVFVAGESPAMFRISEASIEETGVTSFFSEIEKCVGGHVVYGFSAKPESSSHVMWPEHLARQPLFDQMPEHPPGLIGRLRGFLGCDRRIPLAAALQKSTRLSPRWAR